jgi:type II secretory pathway component PulF
MMQLSRKGLVPVSIQEASSGGKAKKPKKEKGKIEFNLSFRRSGRPKMNLRDVLMLTGELSDLLSSGMKLGNALNTLSKRRSEKGQDKIIADLRDEIIQGSSLSEALSRWPETFSPLYVSMVRAGEASGALAEALIRLRDHYERVLEARETVGMALIYPAIIMVLGSGTLVFAMLFVVPRFTSIFEELGSTLPLATRILIKFSSILGHYGVFILVGIIALSILLRRSLRTESGKRTWHRLQLRIPVMRDIVACNAFSHFARTLGALLQNGVPVLKALTIVEETVGNVVIAREIHEARDRVTDGSSISGPLASGKVFPSMLTDMLAVGEQTGDITSALNNIARRYDNELDRHVKILTTVLEPIMMVVMAVMVGYMAIAMLLAVFDLTSGLNV